MKRSRLRRATPIKQVNRERLAKRRAAQFGPQASACRHMACSVCSRPPPSDPAHVRSRGAGGLDWANVIPLCRECHIEQGTAGVKTFQLRHGINMKAIAIEISRTLEEE